MEEKQTIIKHILYCVNSIESAVVFQKGFQTFAEGEGAAFWNHAYNPISLLVMGFGRHELFVKEIEELLLSLSLDKLLDVANSIEKVLIL